MTKQELKTRYPGVELDTDAESDEPNGNYRLTINEGECGCGCRRPLLGKKSSFIPGHDARYKSLLIQADAEGVEVSIDHDGMLQTTTPMKLAQDRGWGHFIDKAREVRQAKAAKAEEVEARKAARQEERQRAATAAKEKQAANKAKREADQAAKAKRREEAQARKQAKQEADARKQAIKDGGDWRRPVGSVVDFKLGRWEYTGKIIEHVDGEAANGEAGELLELVEYPGAKGSDEPRTATLNAKQAGILS